MHILHDMLFWAYASYYTISFNSWLRITNHNPYSLQDYLLQDEIMKEPLNDGMMKGGLEGVDVGVVFDNVDASWDNVWCKFSMQTL